LWHAIIASQASKKHSPSRLSKALFFYWLRLVGWTQPLDRQTSWKKLLRRPINWLNSKAGGKEFCRGRRVFGTGVEKGVVTSGRSPARSGQGRPLGRPIRIRTTIRFRPGASSAVDRPRKSGAFRVSPTLVLVLGLVLVLERAARTRTPKPERYLVKFTLGYLDHTTFSRTSPSTRTIWKAHVDSSLSRLLD
jgi:hypothetical protein